MADFTFKLRDGSVVQDGFDDETWNSLSAPQRDKALRSLAAEIEKQHFKGVMRGQETEAAEEEFARKEAVPTVKKATGLPVRMRGEGLPAEFGQNPTTALHGPGPLSVRAAAQRQATAKGAASVLEQKLTPLGYKVHYVEIKGTDPLVAVQEPGKNDVVLLDYPNTATTGTVADYTTDVAAAVGTWENVLATAGGAAGAVTGLLRRVGLQTLGGFVGGVADHEVNKALQGVQTGDTLQDTAAGILFRNLGLSMVSEGLLLGTGRMPLRLSADDKELVETFAQMKANWKQAGAKAPGAVTADRKGMALGNVNRAMVNSVRVRETMEAREKAIALDLQVLLDKNKGDLSKADLDELGFLEARVLDKEVRVLSKNFDPKVLNLSATEVGGLLQRGEDQMAQIAKGKFTRSYNDLREMGRGAIVTLDEPLLTTIRGIKAGIEGTTRNESGRFASVQLRDVGPKLLKEIDKLEALALADKGRVGLYRDHTAFEQLREVDRNLRPLANKGLVNQEPQSAHWAGQVRDELRRVMDNPEGATDPRFTGLWKENTLAYRQWEELLDLSEIKRIANESEPARLASGFSSTNARAVSVLVDQMPEEFSTIYKTSVVSDLMANPGAIHSRLDEFAKAREVFTLRKVINQETEGHLRQLADTHAALQSPVAQKIIAGATGGEAFLTEAFDSLGAESSKLVKQIVDVVGFDSAEGRALGRGLYTNIVKSSASKTVKGALDPRKAAARIDSLDGSGMLDAALKPTEAAELRARANVYRRMATTQGAAGDTGSSIAARQTASEASQIGSPVELFEHGGQKGFRGTLKSIYDAGLGWMLLSGHNERIMLSSARPGSEAYVRAGAVVGTRLMQDVVYSAANWTSFQVSEGKAGAENVLAGWIAKLQRKIAEAELLQAKEQPDENPINDPFGAFRP